MKLWQKDHSLDRQIERFTVGQDRELDLLPARYDIQGSLAHARMLQSIGLLTTEEHEQLDRELKRIYKIVEAGEFRIEEGVEDVHSQVELLLTRQLGDVGKKIHSGRSRNDQVLVDLRLFFRAEIKEIAGLTQALFDRLTALAEQHKDVLMPGYTHFQVAMVSSFGLWFGAYAESLTDDMQLLQSVYRINNQNPLGSAAGYGSSFPLDRRMTTELLGFDDLSYNVVHAQLGRGKTELFVSFALAALSSTLGKMAMDVVLFMNQNFAFISFPDELTTGSSIMPHKKNPDVFELIRGRCNQLQSLPAQVSALTANLPSGYHRDFQLLKEALFPALIHMKDCLSIAEYALQHIRVKENILDDEKYRYIYSVEEVNRETLRGTPFRDAYKKVGQSIEKGAFEPDRTIRHTHEGSIGNLCLPEIRAKMEKAMAGFGFEKVEGKIGKLISE
jgi:argininosuccinate lyase